MASGPGPQAELVAGHSLGELVALYAAGVFDFATGLALMQTRSALMAAAGGGAMTAVMGFDRASWRPWWPPRRRGDRQRQQQRPGGALRHARRRWPGERALQCKRAIPLAVSGAFHSPFMAEAAAAFAAELDAVPFADAAVPVLSNTEPTPQPAARPSRHGCGDQMTTGVRWRETMEPWRRPGSTPPWRSAPAACSAA
jgi:[acyl-carrier-protein] S-malonyltransferase